MEAQHKQVEQKDLERSVENGTVSQFTMPIRSYIPHGHAVLIIDRFTLETPASQSTGPQTTCKHLRRDF